VESKKLISLILGTVGVGYLAWTVYDKYFKREVPPTPSPPSHGREVFVIPTYVNIANFKDKYHVGDEAKIEVDVVVDKTLNPDEYGVCHVTLYVKDPSGRVSTQKSDIVIKGGNSSSTFFYVTLDKVGTWNVWAIGTDSKGGHPKRSITLPLHVVQPKVTKIGEAYIRNIKLSLDKTKCYVFDTVNGKFEVTLDRVVTEGVACIPAVLMINDNPSHIFWLYAKNTNKVSHKLSIKMGTIGDIPIWIQIRNPIPIMTTPTKVDWHWIDDMYVVSNGINIKVLPLPLKNAICGTITPERNTLKFMLRGGKYQLVAERMGDIYPRVIKVTEDNPPSDPKAKVLLNDLILIVSAPYIKTITVDSGVHDVYVYISCGTGKWKVCIQPIY